MIISSPEEDHEETLFTPEQPSVRPEHVPMCFLDAFYFSSDKFKFWEICTHFDLAFAFWTFAALALSWLMPKTFLGSWIVASVKER
jgi:hypothetical protein